MSKKLPLLKRVAPSLLLVSAFRWKKSSNEILEIKITDGLQSGQSYEFTIIAENAAGQSEKSDILNVDMLPPG